MTENRGKLGGFVSTSILTSSDGLFGDNTEEKRVEHAPAVKEGDESGKSLYDQLQERKEEQDREWKSKNNPFAPPKALDDEEIEYIRHLESQQTESDYKRKEQYNSDKAQFLLARGSGMKADTSKSNRSESSDFASKSMKTSQTNNQFSVRLKRKAKKEDDNAKKKQKKVEEKPTTATIGLVAYSSDSDSE